jgi:hypothetical protein
MNLYWGDVHSIYDVEIRQVNGQLAWLSPVFVLS